MGCRCNSCVRPMGVLSSSIIFRLWLEVAQTGDRPKYSKIPGCHLLFFSQQQTSPVMEQLGSKFCSWR